VKKFAAVLLEYGILPKEYLYTAIWFFNIWGWNYEKMHRGLCCAKGRETTMLLKISFKRLAGFCTVFSVLIISCLLFAALPVSAVTINEYLIPGININPNGITLGVDGNIWFNETGTNNIGQITPAGYITEFPVSPTFMFWTGFGSITNGPDLNIWFSRTGNNVIGRITPAGVVTEFQVPTPGCGPGGSFGNGITAGPDGNIWFTEFWGNKIGYVTPLGDFTEFTLPTDDSQPNGITTGPDGNIWFTECNNNRIGRITPLGDITEFTLPTPNSWPGGACGDSITAGPDGNLWFTEWKTTGNNNKIGRITPSGIITEFPLSSDYSGPMGITTGPDGNIWFVETQYDGNNIGRITPSGVITEFPIPTANAGLGGIVVGSDSNLWFTECNGNKIGQLILATVPPANTISLPKTGQTTSYAAGDDGAIQAGVAWPSPRFTDNGDQTVTDNLTGLIWTKDTGTPTVGTCPGGIKTWQDALDYVACLNSSNYLGHHDWRLPNANEFYSLVDRSRYNPALPAGHPFANYQTTSKYWTSTTDAGNAAYAGCGDMQYGLVNAFDKSFTIWVWPVRAGQCGSINSAICLPRTGQTTIYAAGDDGAIQAGVAWPIPRFTDNGDQTVMDNLTGLMWIKDAGVPNVGTCTGGAMFWQTALDYIECLNSSNYLGHDDWRLPNFNELISLIDRSTFNPVLPLNHPFTNVQLLPGVYWSSTTPVQDIDFAMFIYTSDTNVNSTPKYGNWFLYVWPVRAGSVTIPIDTTPPTTTASPAGGTHSSAQSVVLPCYDGSGSGCQATYYCFGSGCNPTTLFAGPITISSSDVLRFYSKDNSNNSESVKTETYIINIPDTTSPTTTASPIGGTYGTAQDVTLTCDDNGGSGCQKTYYCLGSGCMPITEYSGPIHISSSTVLKFYSKDNANNSEQPLKIETYTITSSVTHTINVSTDGNGQIIANGITFPPAVALSVNDGATQTFYLAPGNDSKVVMSGTCGGNIDPNTGTYTTNQITQPCSVIATFILMPSGPSQNLQLPSGENVQVLVPASNGLITITFDHINDPGGNLSVSEMQCNNPATNFTFIGTCYNIEFTGTPSGDIYVTIPYGGLTLPQGITESQLQIYHGLDICTCTDPECAPNPNTLIKTITGKVTSLSPFGIAYFTGTYAGVNNTGANENMIALIAILAISTGIMLVRRMRLN
jgi:streptogramin lyase